MNLSLVAYLLTLHFSSVGCINVTFLKNWSSNSTDVLRENTEAVVAACDAAHGRWAKLLGVRALLHPRLRLQEFLCIYNITQEFITATEKVFIFILVY